MDSVNVLAKFKVRIALPVPAVWGGVVSNLQSRPSIVTFLYAFQRYCHFCAPARYFFGFPTPPLLVSPKFSHVPLEVGGWPLVYEERSC